MKNQVMVITYENMSAILTEEAVIARARQMAIDEGDDPDKIYSPDAAVREPTWFVYFEEALESMLSERGLLAEVEIEANYIFVVRPKGKG